VTDWLALFRSLTPSDTIDSIDTIRREGGCVSRVNCVTGVKSKKVVPVLLGASDLLDRYEERAAIVQFDGGEDRRRAEARAWNEVAAIWYRQHGEKAPGGLCAGCDEALGAGTDVLLLPHGERAHADDGYDCVIAYGRSWKKVAAAALASLGIPSPSADEIEPELVTAL